MSLAASADLVVESLRSKDHTLFSVFTAPLEPAGFVCSLQKGGFNIVPSEDGFSATIAEVAHAHPKDHTRSSQPFGLHKDGQYYTDIPQTVILYCADPGQTGIPTVFGDTRVVVAFLEAEGLLDTLANYQFVYRRKDGQVYVRPTMERHVLTGELIMNLAVQKHDFWIRPVPGSDGTEKEAAQLYARICDFVKHEVSLTVHHWRKHDVVVFDNLTLMHGRGVPQQGCAHVPDPSRLLHRFWINKS